MGKLEKVVISCILDGNTEGDEDRRLGESKEPLIRDFMNVIRSASIRREAT